MKQVTLKLTALVMLMGGAITATKAQSNADAINVVTTAVPFLRISPDARSGGMGDVGIAVNGGANANFWNLGRTPFAKCKGAISATYTPWLSDLKLNDVYFATLAGYYQLDNVQAISASFRYFSLGNIQFTDFSGANLQQFRPREFAVDLGYSRKLGKKSGLGVALRYISSDLAGGSVNGVSYKKGSAVAGDLHFFHNGTSEAGNGLNWGVTLSNLGSKISYTSDATQKDYIPANLGVGIAYNKAVDADNKLTFGLDLNKLLVPTPPLDDQSADALKEYRSKGVVSSWFSSFGDADQKNGELKEVTMSIGGEYVYRDQFAFRAGYFYENKTKGDRRYFTLGAGLRYNMVGFNFAYLLPTGSGVNRNPLSNTIRFGLNFRFGCKKDDAPVATPVEAYVAPAAAPVAAVVAPKDTDGDGILDDADKCPTVVGFAKYQGCPIPDTDGDGINDEVDKCPKLAGIPENFGCPTIVLYYLRDEAELNADDKAQLDKVAAFLEKNQGFNVTIVGHTSALGADAYNQTLSEKRAAASKDYLVSKGVPASRLRTVGKGETMTIGDQSTEEGRAKSRRVEIKVD